MKEVWKFVVGTFNYEVSSLGNIRSRAHLVRCSFRSVRQTRARLLKPFVVRSTGYLQIEISGKRRSLHRLVAEAFLGPPSAGKVVNHKNGVRSDNRAENLEWISHSENVRDGFKRGRKPTMLGRFSRSHPTSKRVISTCLKTGAETVYHSAMDAVRSGFDSGCISRCCSGKNANHKGFLWRWSNSDIGRIEKAREQAA